MVKKTTTPALVRRYFEQKAEVGDSSKDLIVEPEYVLVFTGKVSYQKLAQKRVVAWLPPSKKRFYTFKQNAFSEQIVELIKKWAPKDRVRFLDQQGPILKISQQLTRLVMVINDTEEKRKAVIKGINNNLQDVTEKEIWEYLDQNKGFFESLWSNENNLSGLDDKLAVEIVTRRLIS